MLYDFLNQYKVSDGKHIISLKSKRFYSVSLCDDGDDGLCVRDQ